MYHCTLTYGTLTKLLLIVIKQTCSVHLRLCPDLTQIRTRGKGQLIRLISTYKLLLKKKKISRGCFPSDTYLAMSVPERTRKSEGYGRIRRAICKQRLLLSSMVVQEYIWLTRVWVIWMNTPIICIYRRSQSQTPTTSPGVCCRQKK